MFIGNVLIGDCVCVRACGCVIMNESRELHCSRFHWGVFIGDVLIGDCVCVCVQ